MNTSSANQSNPYAPPQAEVRDTMQGDEVELAGRGHRFGAAILDGVIGLVLVGAPLFIGADWQMMAAGNTFDAFTATGLTVAAASSLVLIAITAYLVYTNGQTIGKKALGIKVVRSDGSRASFSRIFWLRNIVNGIPGVIPWVGNVYQLVDHLFIFGERRQCVHDRIADTIVVRA